MVKYVDTDDLHLNFYAFQNLNYYVPKNKKIFP